MSLADFDIRGKMAWAELAERVIEDALDQQQPSVELTGSLQRILTYTKHRDRDKARDVRRG